MAQASDDHQAFRPKDLVFLLAIAGRIDAQSRLIAKDLDKDQSIYYAYAIVDSLSSSYTMFKYFFDVFSSSTSNDTMHDILCSPFGMIGIGLETLFLVTYSFLAFKYDSEKEDSFKKFIATSWPYFRDVMKGLKNAYKGWRAAIGAYSLIVGVDAKNLIIPVGLVLGVFAAANRFWIRSMLEKRKLMMVSNAELLTEIMRKPHIRLDEFNDYLKRLEYQSIETRQAAFAAAAAGGIIDGLYLYVGVLSLTTLTGAALPVMATICALYTLATIVTRLYEEYDFQLRLLVTHSKCRLVLTSKILETSYAKLLQLKAKANKTADDLTEILHLEKEIKVLIGQFEEQRNILSQQMTRGYSSSILLGLKNGLYAYGALASIMFFIGSAIALGGIGFPPALLITCISLGLGLITACIAEAIYTDHWLPNKSTVEEEHPLYQNLISISSELERGDDNHLLSKEEFKKSINDGLDIDASLQYYYQERLEIFRSLFSGFGKGQKFVGFVGSSFQDRDEQGHYHDSFAMNCMAVVSGLLFGIILAMRALARGFGRQQLGQVSMISEQEVIPDPPPPAATAVDEKPPIQTPKKEKKDTQTTTTKSKHISYAQNKLNRFFKTMPPDRLNPINMFGRSNSEPALNKLATVDTPDTIQGLE